MQFYKSKCYKHFFVAGDKPSSDHWEECSYEDVEHLRRFDYRALGRLTMYSMGDLTTILVPNMPIGVIYQGEINFWIAIERVNDLKRTGVNFCTKAKLCEPNKSIVLPYSICHIPIQIIYDRDINSYCIMTKNDEDALELNLAL